MAIGKKIVGGYVVVLVLLALVVAVAFYAIDQVQSTYDGFIDVEVRLADGADALSFEASDQVANYRGILLFPERHKLNLEKLQENRRRFRETIAAMRELVSGAEGRGILDEITALQAEAERAQDPVIALVQRNRRLQALRASIEEARDLNRLVMEKVAAFRNRELERVREGRAELTATVRFLTLAMAGMSLLAILLGLGIGSYLSRAITRQLRESINQLSSSASEILATTTQVAAGAAETATAVTETTTTVEEVKQTAQVASQKARHVSDTAQKASSISQVGRNSVDETVRGMQRIQDQMVSIADSIVRLSEQSQAIAEIIATVNGLAEQSNLLAVNAAIEATRAGDQGKSFGVVAAEIRSLAEQSKQATTQVRTILGDIQKATSAAVLATEQGNKAVNEGVRQAGETGESIRLLAESITEAAQAAMQIAASSQQQMVGMDQVAMAMDNIKQASMQNVSGTKQAEVAAQDLHRLGQRLGALIGSGST